MSGGERIALVTGAEGQLGRALVAGAPGGWKLRALGRAALDVTDGEATCDAVARERPAVVFNLAAYTAVDLAEEEPARAEAVNVAGAAHVAGAAAATGARVIHLSTDFVFDGTQGRPYAPGDPPSPLNVYGRTKLAGEREVLRAAGSAATIVRTAWLYAPEGRNFLRTMLRAMRERDEVRVVVDQVGTPTAAGPLAAALWTIAERPEIAGLLHWTDAGVASWYDFAVAIQEEALALGYLRQSIPVRPIRSSEFPAAARRPPYSVLDKTETWRRLELQPVHWRVRLRETLARVARD